MRGSLQAQLQGCGLHRLEDQLGNEPVDRDRGQRLTHRYVAFVVPRIAGIAGLAHLVGVASTHRSTTLPAPGESIQERRGPLPVLGRHAALVIRGHATPVLFVLLPGNIGGNPVALERYPLVRRSGPTPRFAADWADPIDDTTAVNVGPGIE